MTTTNGEIARSEPERTNEKLSGTVWLCQGRNQWPVTMWTDPAQVIHWLADNPDGAAWEYHITPMRRVQVVRPEPYLQEAPLPSRASFSEMAPVPEPEESDG